MNRHFNKFHLRERSDVNEEDDEIGGNGDDILEQHQQRVHESAIQEEGVTQAQLREFCSLDMNYINSSWYSPMRRCILKLLQTIPNEEDIESSDISVLALFILPGTISRLLIAHKMHGAKNARARQFINDRPVVHLNRLADSEDVARDIIDLATMLYKEAGKEVAGGRVRRDNGVEAKVTRMAGKVEKACKAGRISVATRIVDSMEEILGRQDGTRVEHHNGPTATADMIEALFPRGTEEDIVVHEDREEEESLQLPVEAVRAAVQGLQTDRASGHSGWTNVALRKLGTTGSEAEQTEFATALAALFNWMLRGRASTFARTVWSASKLALVPKDSGTSFRPIGIGEVFHRCMASAAMTVLGPRVVGVLQPLQLGVGVRGGVEIAAVLADLGYHMQDGAEGSATMSVDIKNAYNSMRRRRIYNGLLEMVPSVAQFFSWMYGGAIQLKNSRGAGIGVAESGCLQGDPLSSLYFAVALHPVLRDIAARVEQLDGGLGEGQQRGVVCAIQDDITIQARMSTVFGIARELQDLLGDLTLNLSKSFIVGPGVQGAEDPPEGWVLYTDGGKTLGRPLGSLDHQEDWIRRRLEERAPPRRALRYTPTRCTLLMLRSSYARRFDYLAKTTSLRIAEEIFKSHDDRIEERLMELVPGADRDILKSLRVLPLQQGGLGIPALCGADAERHYAVTRRRVTAFLEEFHPHLQPVHRYHYYHGEERRGVAITDLEEEAARGMLEEHLEGDEIAAFSRAARTVTAKATEADGTRLLEELTETHGMRGFAAQFRSSMHRCGGSWLRAVPPFEGKHSFPESAFREALLNRVLAPFAGAGQRGNLPCTCRGGGPIDIVRDISHPLVCPHGQGLVTGRHNAIRDRLAKFLRSAVPGGRVEVEPRRHQGQEFTRFPDIHVEIAGGAVYIDVVVAEPMGAVHIAHSTLSSVTEADGAALQAEERKRLDYDAHAQAIRMIPFAVEATGRIGPAARRLLEEVGRGQERATKTMMRDLDHICASFRGRILSACRQRLADVNER
jgi:hypothetical protein